MRRCERCGVAFAGELERCPLCDAELQGDATPSPFPRNEVKRSGTMALRVIGFATGTAVLAMLFVGHMFSLHGELVFGVCLALLTNYLFVRHILLRAPDFLRLMARYFLVLLALAALWFVVTGNQFVATWVIPCVCLVALVFDAVLVCVFRGTFVSGYAKYLLFNVVFGLVPLALSAAGLTTWDVPSYVSAFVACVLFLALLVFMRERLMAEVRKLFTA